MAKLQQEPGKQRKFPLSRIYFQRGEKERKCCDVDAALEIEILTATQIRDERLQDSHFHFLDFYRRS